MPKINEQIMDNKYIVLVGDPDSGEWTVAVNTKYKDIANNEFEGLKKDGTPTILIWTGDYLTV